MKYKQSPTGKLHGMLLMGVLMFAGWSLAQANTVTFDPQNSTVDLADDNFTVDIVGTGFVDSTDGGAVSVHFDPSILNAVSVSVDTATWEFFDASGVIDNTTGTITGIEFATFGFPPESFTIGTITFMPVAVGVSTLSLSEFTDGVLGGFGLGGFPQVVDFVEGTVTVVPLPGGVWLFASGIIGLLGSMRKRPTP